MHDDSLASVGPDDRAIGADASMARNGNTDQLAEALRSARRDTLATFSVYEQGLPGLAVPKQLGLNPPHWELGHIGWFQEFWIARNPERHRGTQADPTAPRGRPQRANADGLYDSSAIPHGTRWNLPLPDADATRVDLDRQLARTLDALHPIGNDADSIADPNDALYFHRLALLHEDMHHEAALYMAQALGLSIDDPRWQPQSLPPPGPAITLAPGAWTLGSETVGGFAFDNELNARSVALPGYTIDAQVVRWAEFLPFIERGAYAEDCWWTPPGLEWRMRTNSIAPRYLELDGNGWRRWAHGRWRSLDVTQAAVHLTRHEAEAWCRWRGRRLPTEVEWEQAAMTLPDMFRWGDVWEWTASPFEPYPGFEPHPYRDYSQPWFDGRPVLRGASFMTQPRMHHPRYRNFFPADRNDVPAGFRSCAN